MCEVAQDGDVMACGDCRDEGLLRVPGRLEAARGADEATSLGCGKLIVCLSYHCLAQN